MERKLASIQKVLDIQPIEGADRIEVASVLGWKCVVGKNEFKINELIIFLEVDSVTPNTDAFRILKDSNYRVKTRKFRRQISQGVCLPLHATLAEKYFTYCSQLGITAPEEGLDVSELLGITKYEPYVPAQLAGQVKGNFPGFLQKTDEIRIQTVPGVLYRHQGKKFYVTEKLDGSSMTVYFRRHPNLIDGEFGVCSRNLDIRETADNSFWKVARALDLENKLKALNLNVCLQGELIGHGVQKNKYNLPGLEYHLFNVFDIDKHEYLSYDNFVGVAKHLELKTVPVIATDYILPNTVDELVGFSKGKSVLNPNSHREGIVLRPIIEEHDEDLGRLSFKCINPEFLLKYDD